MHAHQMTGHINEIQSAACCIDSLLDAALHAQTPAERADLYGALQEASNALVELTQDARAKLARMMAETNRPEKTHAH